MKELLKYISDNDAWIIEQNPNGTITLSRNIEASYIHRQIVFEKDEIATLIGLLTTLEQSI